MPYPCPALIREGFELPASRDLGSNPHFAVKFTGGRGEAILGPASFLSLAYSIGLLSNGREESPIS